MAVLRHVAVPANAEQLTFLRHELEKWLRGLEIDVVDVNAVVLASYEALANVAEHAYADGTGLVDMHATYHPASAQLQVRVKDQGRWQLAALSSMSSALTRGRGFPLMQRLADTVDVDPGSEGTTVRLGWTRPRGRK